MAEEQIEQDAGAVDLSGIGSFDFTPDWAKGRSDDKSRYARFEQRGERDEPPQDRRDGGRGKPGFGDRRDAGHGKPRFGERRDFGKGRPAFGERREGGRDDRGPRREFRPFVKPLDAEVRSLPSQKDLGAIIRKIQTTHLAYPLRQLERLFLENPGSCMLRVTPRGEAAESVSFHQCKACGFVAFSEDELAAHLVSAHLGDYWTAEEIECEPPKGAFTCVAKCGLSGELLGPPNLHGYDARIREMIRSRYPNMSEADYRARIEIVRDPEAVEAWRQSATKKTIFRKKGEADAPAVEREVAEMEFRRQFAPAMTSSPKAVDVPADQALKASNRAFLFACRDAIEFEKRRPRNLSFALHGAFHHRKLEFFRANNAQGPEFVVAAKLTPLDTAHAIPELVALVKYVEEHGEVTRADLLTALAGGDEKKAAEIKAHISWLVEKGHLVGFSDGVISAPEKFPRHTPPGRRPAPEPKVTSPVEEAPTGTTGVPPVEDAPVEESVPEQSKEEPKVEEPKVEIQEEVKKDETADQLAE